MLAPGGRFLLETMHRDEVIAAYAERDAWTLPDGTEVEVRRRFDPGAGVSHERLVWRSGHEHGEKRHALRLRTATEIDALLRAAGFERIEIETVERRSRAASARDAAVALVQGTPMRADIEEVSPGQLQAATDAAEAALVAHFHGRCERPRRRVGEVGTEVVERCELGALGLEQDRGVLRMRVGIRGRHVEHHGVEQPPLAASPLIDVGERIDELRHPCEARPAV